LFPCPCAITLAKIITSKPPSNRFIDGLLFGIPTVH
jgi:hypothetical protein